jgi:carboxylesterase
MAGGISAEQARRLGTLVWYGALAVGVTSVAAVTGLSWLSRAKARGLESRPDPAPDYAGALDRLAQLEALDDERVNPVCYSRALLHGQRTRRVVILVHGLTNCPQQWAPFADQLHACGINVLLPRMPRHGYADRLTTDMGNLRAEELRDFGDQVVDIATGLGDEVVIAGISAGGIVAAWAGQYRPELAKSVLIAPSLGFGTFGGKVQLLLMNVALALPDVATQRFTKVDRAMPYAYIGWSSRALGEVLRLGLATFLTALKQRPAVQNLLIVTNANDPAVNNGLTRQLVSLWQARGLQQVAFYEFDRSEGLEHDLIDPNNPRQRIDLVYPILLDLLTRDDVSAVTVDRERVPNGEASSEAMPLNREEQEITPRGAADFSEEASRQSEDQAGNLTSDAHVVRGLDR